MKNEKGRFLRGLDILSYGLTAFLALGCEGLLAFGIEEKLYGCPIKQFDTRQKLIHWVITYMIWGLFSVCICRSAKKNGLDLFKKNDKKIRPVQWLGISAGVAVCLIITWNEWNGSKVLTEFENNGALKFAFQYVYYLIEVFLVMLIVICGQNACEVWFGKENIPYGGIVAALTWGLAHCWSKGSAAAGIEAAFCGFMLGSVYLLTNRDTKICYPLLCIIFIL